MPLDVYSLTILYTTFALVESAIPISVQLSYATTYFIYRDETVIVACHNDIVALESD